MKNIFISELLNQKDLPVFPVNASLADLVRSVQDTKNTHQFYLVDSEGRLEGVITSGQIMEYLTPHFFLTDRNMMDSLFDSLESVKAADLLDRDFPQLFLNQNLPRILEAFLVSGKTAVPVLNGDHVLVGEVVMDALLRVIPVKQRETLYAIS